MDVSTLRSEIKLWEHDFKKQHGRDPHVQDIKRRPDLAEKYKLYKRLSKEKQPSIISKPRAIKTERPSNSNNPFSPIKNRQPSRVPPNTFATPVKARRPPKDLSPDPFPLIQPQQVVSSSQLVLPPPPNSAISRARKRLRGDPVSPSPIKIKRQRVASQIPLQLPTSESNDSDGIISNDDSPVKPPAGSKLFMSLFSENSDTRSDQPKRTLGRTTTGIRLFDRPAASALFDDHIVNRLNGKVPQPKRTVPGLVKSRKRSFTDTEVGESQVSKPHAPALIPPSPPLTSSNRINNRYNGKGKGVMTKKIPKASLNEIDEDDNSLEEKEEKVKMIERKWNRLINSVDELFEGDFLYRQRNLPEEPLPNSSTAEGEFVVNVPEDILQVLAISPSKSVLRQDERVVRALLHGTRAGHYDPIRGGHIWDAGECDEDEDLKAEVWEKNPTIGNHKDSDDDDEWEGEGVAWSTAEL